MRGFGQQTLRRTQRTCTFCLILVLVNDDAAQLAGASALLSVQQQQHSPRDPGEEPVPSVLPHATRHQLWAVPRKTSLWLLCQDKHIWEMCPSRCKATAETSAKVPATAVVAFVCMLLPLSQSVSFSCHKLELIWLSFREISRNSNCIVVLQSKNLSGWLYRAIVWWVLFHFLEIYWHSPVLSRAGL